jgi:hypothetical protein
MNGIYLLTSSTPLLYPAILSILRWRIVSMTSVRVESINVCFLETFQTHHWLTDESTPLETLLRYSVMNLVATITGREVQGLTFSLLLLMSPKMNLPLLLGHPYRIAANLLL